MELLGSTLKEKWPGSVTRIPMKTIVPVMQELLSALAHIHKLGFIHRDIKPENVICSLDDPSGIKLIDFNLAKPISAGPPSKCKYDPISESKTIMGTVHWASLNSMHGIELSPRDDLESLAYVGLFLVRADLPWRNGPRDQTIKRSIKRVRDLKAKWTGAELGAGCDPEFGDLLDYSRGLSFYCLPDYDMWNSRFTDLALRSSVVPGEPLDWTPEALPASIPQLSVSCEAVDFDPALDVLDKRPPGFKPIESSYFGGDVDCWDFIQGERDLDLTMPLEYKGAMDPIPTITKVNRRCWE